MDIEALKEELMIELRKEIMEEVRKEIREALFKFEVEKVKKRKRTDMEVELTKEEKDEFVNWLGWYEFDKNRITYFTLRDTILMCGMESKGMMWERAFAKYVEFELGVPREPVGNRRFKFRSLD